MLTKIIEFSIKNKLIIGLFTMFLIGYGIYELKHLPIDAVPDITDNQTQVITVVPSLGAPDVERLITFPIEQANSNIPGLKEMRSFSRFGLSIVTIVFDEKTDIYWARQQVTERLQQVQAQIPDGLGIPVLAPVTTGLGEVYQYTVRAKEGYEEKYDAMELRTIQDWIVRRQLLGVKGVAEVSSFGGFQKQYEVAVNPGKLSAYNITITDLYTALESNNQNTGGAYIEKGPVALFIRSEGLVENTEDIEKIVVKTLPNGIPLLIRDVAEVRLGHATRYGALTYNGERQVSGAVVMMLKGANSNEVIKNIKERVAEIQKTLPEGVVIEPFLDRTKMVSNSISTVTTNLIEGALIVIFVLVLFLGNFRAGFLVASVIPLSMLFAIIMMNLFGVSGNLMSLGALDFGLIVDGAVIIVEAVLHRFSSSKQFASLGNTSLTQQQMDNTVKESASRMMNSAVFGQVIILIVYLPIFSLQGIEGKMFKPMAQTVAFALIGAFILSLTYIPMMSSLLLSRKITDKKTMSDRMMEKVEYVYQRVIVKALSFSKVILLSVLGLFALSVVVLTRLGGEFIPDLPEGDYAVETRVLTGSSLTTSVEAVSKSSKILLDKFPEVERIVTKTGSSEVPMEPLPVDVSDMIIVLKDRKEWTSAKTYEELERKMIQELKAVPGVTFGFQFPVAMRFNELISGARQDVVCKIFGENMDTLDYYAKKIGAICTTIEGTTGLYVEAVSGMPQIVINYDRVAIAQYGLNISDINRVVNSAFAGEVSGSVFEGEKRFDLVVRMKEEKRKELSDVQNLLIPAPAGNQVPLSAVANVAIVDSPNQIQRENSQRRIMVGFNVDGRDVQSMVTELQSKIEQQIKLPPGYYISYGGAFKNLEAAKERLYIAVPLSLLLIFLLLYFAFRSVKQGLLIYSAIPLSAIGGILALAVRGIPFSISAGVGFIALFGVAVLNGIILIAEFNRLQKEGMKDIRQLVIKGTTTRLRPVLMTAFVASLGFLPMAISNGEGAEVQRPLATVVIGGLMVATLLTLFVLPILYIAFQRKTNTTTVGVLAILMVFSAQMGIAQTPVSLNQAVEMALQQNRAVKNERLVAEYRRKLIHSGSNLPQTSVVGEYGQMNSIYTDLRLGVSQNISFPTVYTSQKALLNEEWKSSVLNAGLKEVELTKQVGQAYYDLAYLLDKQRLLEKTDSLFSKYRDIAILRYEKGEVNILEKATADNQQGQIKIQLIRLQRDLEIALLRFQLLLNTETVYVPESDEAVFSRIPSVADTSLLSTHPALQYLKQQQEVAVASTHVERQKLLPDLTVGYNVMGMQGTGADDVAYDRNLRFQSVYLGVGIPIFFGGQKAKITASKMQETIARNEYETNRQLLETTYLTVLESYKKYQEEVEYFEETALKNAVLVTEAADKQYQNGDINYLERVLLINQSVEIQNNYIETLRNRNMAITEINYFITQ